MEKIMTEEGLKEKAVVYLRDAYGEDTVSMEVIENGIQDGDGVLHVDCTVSVGGVHSDWTKWVTFKGGEVESMRWQAR